LSGNSGTSARKERHLEVCVDPGRFRVETMPGGAGFDRVSFLHRALPELSLDQVDLSVGFLGYRLSMPLLVSCMTGGSAGGGRVNHGLARAANAAKVAFGLGSFRVLLRDPSFLDDFRVKRFLPDVPLLANIGAVVLREAGADAIFALARSVEADALVVHLNPGQELFQEGGDRDFRGLRDALTDLIAIATIPVIVKETGFGIGPADALSLLDAGAAWVDLAGAGGTNWIAVEAARREGSSSTDAPSPLRQAAADFDAWGAPTALLLAATGVLAAEPDRRWPAPVVGAGTVTGAAPAAGAAPFARGASSSPAEDGGASPCRDPFAAGFQALPLIASGGLRNGVEVAKALALGAGMAAMALPLVRAVEGGGEAGVGDYLERVAIGLRSAMLLTGSRTVDELRRGILRCGALFVDEARDLAMVDDHASDLPS
jgi:isopentenyl-diphosphate delta-isomerase type 2